MINTYLVINSYYSCTSRNRLPNCYLIVCATLVQNKYIAMLCVLVKCFV